MTETAATDRRSGTRALAERILVLAPTGDDAALVQRILREHGRDVTVVNDLAGLVQEITLSAGAAVVAAEALEDRKGCVSLREVLQRQEPWSDLPLIMLGGGGEAEAAQVTEMLGASAHLLILERPLGVSTLLTAIDAALRSRRRQYEVRRLLTEIAASAAEVARAHDEANRAKDEFIATIAHELPRRLRRSAGGLRC